MVVAFFKRIAAWTFFEYFFDTPALDGVVASRFVTASATNWLFVVVANCDTRPP
jgi:hypothetical protein